MNNNIKFSIEGKLLSKNVPSQNENEQNCQQKKWKHIILTISFFNNFVTKHKLHKPIKTLIRILYNTHLNLIIPNTYKKLNDGFEFGEISQYLLPTYTKSPILKISGVWENI